MTGADLGPRLDAVASASGATISVHVGGLDGSTWFARDADRPHPAASTVKVAVVQALHRSGLELRERVAVRAVLPSAVPGASFETTRDYDEDDEPWLRLGGLVRLDWLAERAIVRSSNLATNLLIARLGLGVVDAEYVDAPGCHLTRSIQDAPAVSAGRENSATARGLSRVLTGLDPATEALMARCEHPGLAPALPSGTGYAHKSGWFDGVCHDHGVVRPEHGEPFVLSVLTAAPLPAADHLALLQEVGRAIWSARVGSGR